MPKVKVLTEESVLAEARKRWPSCRMETNPQAPTMLERAAQRDAAKVAEKAYNDAVQFRDAMNLTDRGLLRRILDYPADLAIREEATEFLRRCDLVTETNKVYRATQTYHQPRYAIYVDWLEGPSFREAYGDTLEELLQKIQEKR